MGLIEGFMYGLFGGLVAEIFGLFKLRRESAGHSWLRSPFYCAVTVLMVLTGGGLVVLYLKSEFDLNPLLAFNVGASAPLILGAVTSQVPDVSPGKID